MSDKRKLAIAYTTASEPLAQRIIKLIQPLYEYSVVITLNIKQFSDGEINLQYESNIRGCDLFIVGAICPPRCNDNLMELLLAIDAAKRASATHVTAIIPYFGYARQDRKSASRTPISAKLVTDLLIASGVDRVVVQDIHASQIQGFFPSSIPFDHIDGYLVFIQAIIDRFGEDIRNLIVVSPDAGGAARCRNLATQLHADIAIIDKRRVVANMCDVMNVVGDVNGKICLLYDDIVDTARSLTKAAQALKEKGAEQVFACASHAVLSGEATRKIKESCIDYILLSDSIPLSPKQVEELGEKLQIVSGDFMFANCITCIHTDTSFGESIRSVKVQAEQKLSKITKGYSGSDGVIVSREQSVDQRRFDTNMKQ